MRRSELLLSRKFLIGILIWIAVLIPESEPLRGSALVLQVKNKAAEPKQETDEEIINNNGSISTTNVTKPQLTGIPQIDYVLDPNLPRELNGHNLTDYPFYNAVPVDEIDFKCDGLHDGFYASVPHKCQVYHHCLFGTRFDFLCANYTAFDQKTFICHFVSEVDCNNSPKYYIRNEALYKEATTTSTTTTTTPTPSTTTVSPQPSANGGGMRHGGGGAGGRRRRPYYRRRRPVYEYYYDDDEYADSEYYDDDMATMNHRRNPNRKQNKDHYADNHDADTDYEGHADAVKPSVRTTSGSGSVYERPRAPPKIRRPVPKNERDKYDYTSSKILLAGTSSSSTVSTTTTSTERAQTTSASKSKTSTPAPADDEYYDDDEEYEYDEPKTVAAKGKHHHNMDYDFHGGYEESHRHMSRPRGRMPTRKRTDMYDDYDMKQRPKMSRRKEHTRYDMERPRNARPASHRGRQDDPAPSYSKKRLVDTDHRRRGAEKRPQAAAAPSDDDYYYDEEEEEEEELPPPPPKRQRRPHKATEKPKSNNKSSKGNDQSIVEPRQYEATTKYAKAASFLRGPKSSAATATLPDEDTPRENEIPTTEHLSARTTLALKTVKIVNNSLKDEEDGIDNVSTEETKSSLAQARPHGYIAVTRTLPKPQQQESRRPDQVPSRSVSPLRHFVITAPIRKPSHFGYFANSAAPAAATPPAANLNYRDEIPAKLPEQPKVASTAPEYYKSNVKSGAVAHLVKIPLQNMSVYQPAHGAFYVPMVEQIHQSAPSRKVKPVDEHHLPDTLNVITNGITYNGALVTEAKPFEGAVKPQAYRQDHRLYAVGDRLYTNSITFPHQPPSNFDITAPGPSAPAEDSNAAAATAPATAPEKKYSDLPSYNTANGDYDVTYNEALQPSTTHSVRRYPTTTFFVQNGPTSSRRLPSEYAFNEGAFSSLNRSHSRYK